MKNTVAIAFHNDFSKRWLATCNPENYQTDEIKLYMDAFAGVMAHLWT